MKELNLENLSLEVEIPGQKVQGSAYPELTVLPTINKFGLNAAASKAMGLETKDTITILVNNGTEDLEGKYFLCKGIEGMEATVASVGQKAGVGRSLSFNYSGVWSKMLQAKGDAVELSPQGLVEMGLLEKRTTESGKTAYSATRKVRFEIGEPMEDEKLGKLYPLLSPRIDEDVDTKDEAENA